MSFVRRLSFIGGFTSHDFYPCLGEAESMVRKGGLYVNFERVKSADEVFSKDRHIVAGNTTLIRIGENC